MQQAEDHEVFRQLREGRTLFGEGWRCVDSFDEVDDDLESDEEEEYVVMDLGTAMDARTLQTEATYQLIGMDTPMPFLKIGEHIFQGAVAPLIGDEVVFDVVRQEDDPQRPHNRPAYKTSQRIELRGVNLSLRSEQPIQPPASPTKVDAGGVRSFFPQRLRKKKAKGEEGETMDLDLDPGFATPGNQTQELDEEERQHEADCSLHIQTPATAPAFTTPASVAAAAPGSIPATPTPVDGRRRSGRPRVSTARASLPVSTMTDLADIHHAGGLGDVRLEIADDATPELLAAVSAIRGKPSGPGTKLSRAQEERLVRGLPASGPGSRGGRGGRGRGLGSRSRGRAGARGGMVDPAGEGLAEGFLGEWDEDDGEPGLVAEEGTGEGPSGTADAGQDESEAHAGGVADDGETKETSDVDM